MLVTPHGALRKTFVSAASTMLPDPTFWTQVTLPIVRVHTEGESHSQSGGGLHGAPLATMFSKVSSHKQPNKGGFPFEAAPPAIRLRVGPQEQFGSETCAELNAAVSEEARRTASMSFLSTSFSENGLRYGQELWMRPEVDHAATLMPSLNRTPRMTSPSS